MGLGRGWPRVPCSATGWGHSGVTELCPLHKDTARDSQAGSGVSHGPMSLPTFL